MITDSKGNPVYDMYKIEITYNTGDSKTIKVFCEYGTDIPKEIRNNFLFWNLWGDDGLIEKQGREDYIFLGRLEKDDNGNYVGNRFYKMPNGQDAQAAFEERYLGIKNSLGIENGIEPQAGISGKTYAISDIHGMYNLYINTKMRGKYVS